VIAEEFTLNDADILLEILTNGESPMTPELAQQTLSLRFTDKQRARMLELADRNNAGTLAPLEKQEMLTFAHVGSTLSILHSKARLALRGSGEPS
jgi:hypothetical protein